MSTAHNEDYRILIRSVSEQFEHTEPLPAEETDKIELMTYGSFLKKAGSYYISYAVRLPALHRRSAPAQRHRLLFFHLGYSLRRFSADR